ncbi:MAG: hypothetical protein J6P16_03330 [Eubacterium sp.]|nr:hypothetical protein [Eubacterium sp.]
MTAVKEQFMQMLPQSLSEVPDDEVQYMINILVKWSKPKSKSATDDEFSEYKIKMKKSQQWAKEVGLTPEDITKAIKAVRQEKRQQG